MANVLKSDKRLQIIHLLCEGNSIRSTERLTGVHRDTIMRVLVDFGEKCRVMLDNWMRDLKLRHIQADEIWTFVQKKEGRIHVDEKERKPFIGDQFLFIALDQKTKLIPSFIIGKRTANTTYRFIEDLSKRIVLPGPHDSDSHAFHPEGFRNPVQISTDGFKHYKYSIDRFMGARVLHGVLIKNYRNADMPGRYAAPEMVNTQRIGITQGINLQSICTSHVERKNLSIRTFMKRFARLSLGFSKKLENLEAAVAIHVAHYNFCRRHSTLRMTPAMAAGVTDTLCHSKR